MLREEKNNVNRKVSDEVIKQTHLQHLQGKSIVELSKLIGLTRHNLRKRFITLGLPYQRLHERSTTVHRFFDKIDSEIKAYLLGFIAGDGGITNNGRHRNIAVGVQERDRCIVDWIREYISPNLKILILKPLTLNRQPVAKIQVSSRHIIEDLRRHGLIERKSFNAFILKEIPEEMKRHVFRGFVDADGCVYRNANGKVIVNAVCTSEVFLKQLKEWLKEAGIHSTISKRISRLRSDCFGTKDLFKIGVWSKKDVKLVEEYMYRDSKFYFKRKRLKFFDNTELINRLITVDSVTTTN